MIRRVVLVALALLAVPAAPMFPRMAMAEPAAPAGMGVLRPLLPVGPLMDGIWQGTVDGPTYYLINRRKADAVRYYYVEPKGRADYRAAVSVGLEAGEPASAVGLVYGLDKQAGSYCALVLRPDRSVALFRRDAAGLHLLFSVKSARVADGKPNELSVAVRGGRAEAAVNGAGLAALERPGCAGPGVGIIALSTGRFGFTDFRLE